MPKHIPSSRHGSRLAPLSLLAFVALLVACSSSANSDGANVTSAGAGGGEAQLGGAANASAGTTSSAGASANGGALSAASASGVAGGTASAGNGAVSAGGSPGAAGMSATAGASNGGAGSGGASNGGATSSAGASNGGAAGAGGGATACPGADAAEFNLVSSWLNNTTTMGALPAYAYSNIKQNFPAGAAFDKLACSIAMSCVEWAPMESNWLRQCEAVLTSAIVAESSYTPSSLVNDTYATRTVGTVTANDPTVGLLQIRFSSTVHDYNYYGSVAKMAAIGCTWPSALSSQADTDTWWATNGGTNYLSLMEDVSCNIGLASWYYFYNATSNGGADVVWISDYCAGHGVAGTMVTGLLSHLMGGNYPRPADDTNAYPWGIECCAGGNPSDTTCTGCSGRFAAFMGIGSTNARPSPDPFLQALAPETTKYCR